MANKPPSPPAGLSAAARKLWRTVVTEYELTPADLRILREAAFAFDRAEQARETVTRGGLVYTDRFGAPRQHPAAGLELRHREQFIKAMRELRLDGDALPDPRMPRLASTRVNGGIDATLVEGQGQAPQDRAHAADGARARYRTGGALRRGDRRASSSRAGADSAPSRARSSGGWRRNSTKPAGEA